MEATQIRTLNLSYRMWQGMEKASGSLFTGSPGIRTWSALKRRGLIEFVDVDLGEYGIGGRYALTEKGKTAWTARPDWMRK